jgi:2-polyprenyl-3-methyl-5-hydroxy-6-metoxy-1,4-benzoquinol methylase
MFGASAAYYDLLYREKDYRGEADYVAAAIRDRVPTATTLLDIACGTGEHARFFAEEHGFAVGGIDVEPTLLEIAKAKLPSGSFHVADMVDFDLGHSYDAVVCLFSSIGYSSRGSSRER